MRHRDLGNFPKLGKTERDSVYQSLAPLTREVIDEVILFTLYERQVILSHYPVHRKPAESLLDFTMATMPTYQPEPFHALICDYLDACVNRDIDRLMIFAPPQSGKSQLASIQFPAFHLGRRPNEPAMLLSYAASRAESASRDIRNIVKSPEYAEIFPEVKISRESQAVEFWELAPPLQGQLRAAGVGGGITGYPAKIALIDDPFADWEEAQTELAQNRVWNWWGGTFRGRVHEGAVIIIITTRWNEGDLPGRILNHTNAHRWTVLRLPAIAEDQETRDKNNAKNNLPPGLPDLLGRQEGEVLTPLRFSKPYVLEIKGDMDFMMWNAEYQGAPSAPEGNLIKRNWFKIVGPSEVPKGEFVDSISDTANRKFFRCRGWDKAGTAQEDNKYADRTAGALLLYDSVNNITYIEDMVAGRWALDERDNTIVETAQSDAKAYGHWGTLIMHEQEPGASGKDVAAILNKKLNKWPSEAKTSTGKKDVRAQAFISEARAGRVRIKRADWNDMLLAELTEFPNGRHDDMLDAITLAFNTLQLAKPKKELELL